MRLYRLTTKAGWVFYVVAEDETAARQTVDGLLNKSGIHDSGYGFGYERVVVRVELVAQQYNWIETSHDCVSQLLIADTSSKGGQDA